MTPRLLLFPLLLLAGTANAQARYTGYGPGSYIAVGATGSTFTSDYGHQRTTGATLFLDTNLYRRIGAEIELRALPLGPPHDQPTVRLTTLLAGPKISTHGRALRPYAKLLAGRGNFTFPFNDAHGSYFVAAPGVGLDWRPPHHDLSGDDRPSRFLIRLVDIEYQIWPDFTFGPLHPYGISTGLSYRLF